MCTSFCACKWLQGGEEQGLFIWIKGAAIKESAIKDEAH
jgi:hypothetical protein